MLKVNNRTPPTHTTKMNSSTPSMPPPLEAVYTDLSTATTAIQSHARSHRYALYKRDGKPNRIVYAYDRYRKPPPKRESRSVHESKERTGARSKKCDCKMRVALVKDMLSGQWESKVLHIIMSPQQIPLPIPPTELLLWTQTLVLRSINSRPPVSTTLRF